MSATYYAGEGGYDPYSNRGGVPGAPGQSPHVFNPNANVIGPIHSYNPNAPVGYNPMNQEQRTVISSDPMSQIGNAGAFNIADMPRYINSPPPPNVINKAPHIDSPFIDRWLKERNQLRGPQLPGFV